MRRLAVDELFHIGRGPTGLEEISDDTLRVRLDAAEQARLRRLTEPGYAEAIHEELLQMPQTIINKGDL